MVSLIIDRRLLLREGREEEKHTKVDEIHIDSWEQVVGIWRPVSQRRSAPPSRQVSQGIKGLTVRQMYSFCWWAWVQVGRSLVCLWTGVLTAVVECSVWTPRLLLVDGVSYGMI